MKTMKHYLGRLETCEFEINIQNNCGNGTSGNQDGDGDGSGWEDEVGDGNEE